RFGELHEGLQSHLRLALQLGIPGEINLAEEQEQKGGVAGAQENVAAAAGDADEIVEEDRPKQLDPAAAQEHGEGDEQHAPEQYLARQRQRSAEPEDAAGRQRQRQSSQAFLPGSDHESRSARRGPVSSRQRRTDS